MTNDIKAELRQDIQMKLAEFYSQLFPNLWKKYPDINCFEIRKVVDSTIIESLEDSCDLTKKIDLLIY